MKNQRLLYSVIISLLLFNSLAQNPSLNRKTIGKSTYNSPIVSDKTDTLTRKIKHYHVEEIIQMKFGGYKTIYNVTDIRLISTTDLGPNNKRIITPVFAERKQPNKTNIKSVLLNKIESSTQLSTTDTSKKVEISDLDPTNKTKTTPVSVEKKQLTGTIMESEALNKLENSTQLSISDTSKKADTYAYIDIVKTYERVTDKGYESVDMLKKIANSYFFNNELEKAEKYYSKLFNMKTDLEPEYYYRYSIILESIGEIKKSNEFLKKFNQLNSNTNNN